ncbi:hypothetical protein [Thauera sp. Sel9]|uniref:hypothetical protein n=1 Tax=Thauera sp. Sel9 TaxID=2974299 RepID=UPI0021E11E98|nr:hypothetical protein [Thauera sp. Sel9]
MILIHQGQPFDARQWFIDLFDNELEMFDCLCHVMLRVQHHPGELRRPSESGNSTQPD